MNIELGEYVRTKQGDITKITRFCELEFNKVRINSIVGEDGCLYGNPDKVVKKHSKNIIDLIEPGDYVNGKYVYKNGEDFGGEKCLHMESSEVYACEDFLYEKDIKSIVTKQQFRNMEYEV